MTWFQRWTISFLVGWSLLVHLPGLFSPLLDYHAHRQCQTASMARNFARFGMEFLNPQVDNEGFPPPRAGTEFPIYSYILAILFSLFGPHDILGRLLSMGFTAWSAIFLFRWMQRRLGDEPAFWGAALMCVVPVHLYFTRTVQPESMAMWGFIGYGLYLERWLEKPTWTHAFLTFTLGAVAPLLKLPFLYLMAGLWAALAWENPSRLRRIGFWLLPLFILAPVKLWYHYTASAPIAILPLGLQSQLDNLAPVANWNFWKTQFVSWFPEVCATYTGLMLATIGFGEARRRPDARFWIGLLLTTFLYTVLLGAYGRQHRYTLIPWAPVLGVFIAMGFLKLRQQPRTRVFAWILLIGMPLHTVFRINHWYKVERTYLSRAADVLAHVSGPHETVLTNTREIPVLLYYLNRYGFVVDLDKATPEEVEAQLARGPHFFLTPTEGSWTRQPQWHAWFDKRGRRIMEDPDYVLYDLRP